MPGRAREEILGKVLGKGPGKEDIENGPGPGKARECGQGVSFVEWQEHISVQGTYDAEQV